MPFVNMKLKAWFAVCRKCNNSLTGHAKNGFMAWKCRADAKDFVRFYCGYGFSIEEEITNTCGCQNRKEGL